MRLLPDIRFGWRILAKSPGFTLAAVAAIALGIGVNSMMFTIYNAALVKSLPFENPQEVVHIHNRSLIDQRNNMGTSYRDFLQYCRQAHSLTELAAFQESEYSISDDRSVPDQIDGVRQ